MKVISLSGYSRSGKTTTCELLIRGLRARGYTVGSIKDIHAESFHADSGPPANTGRHRAAGAEPVTARGLWDTGVFYDGKRPIGEILRHYSQDYVILEGVNDCNAPRIITAHDEAGILAKFDGRVIAIAGVFANTHVGTWNGLPIFSALSDPEALLDFVEARALEPLPDWEPGVCAACGRSCRELAADLAHGRVSRDACVLTRQGLSLSVGDTPLTLSPTVQDTLKRQVRACLDTGLSGEVVLRFSLE